RRPRLANGGKPLQQAGAVPLPLEHAAAQAGDAGVAGEVRPGGLGPGPLQVQPRLPPPPAARREQPAEDFAEQFGSLLHRQPRFFGRGWRIEDRQRASILDPRSSILDPPPPILTP